MAGEPIDVEVKDRVADAIRTKLLNIATASLEAWNNVNKLQAALAGLNTSALNSAAAKAGIQQQKLAIATANAATAATRSQSATVALATAQQRLAGASAQAEAAQSRAAAAALRLEQAQGRAARAAQSLGIFSQGLVTKLAGAAGAGFGVKAIIDMGDAYTTLQNKLQNVATSQEQVNELTSRLFDLANKTRAPVEETTTAFVRFDRALKVMGKSQEDTLRLTETVNKALVVSGATAGEQASALLQLSQAFNAGKLQGDEFRSVSENIPIVLDAIAKATNTPVNQLKNLAKEGKITSKVLFDAFKILGVQVDATFAKTVPTVAQSLEILKNKSLQSFGELNKQLGLTAGLARGLIFLANNLDLVRFAVFSLGVVLAGVFGPAAITAILTAVRTVSAGIATAFATNPLALLIGALVIATAAIVEFGDKLTVIKQDNISLLDLFKALGSYVVDAAKSVYSFFADAFGKGYAFVAALFDGLPSTVGESLDLIVQFTKSAVNKQIGFFVGLYDSIKAIFNNLPAAAEAGFKGIVNLGAEAIENVVKQFFQGFGKIGDLIATVAPQAAAAFKSIASVDFKLPRLELSTEAKDVATEVKTAFDKAFSKDYVGGATEDILKRAAAFSRARAEKALAAMRPAGNLRGAGPDLSGKDVDKNAEKRALFLARVNAELDKQLRSYGMLAEQRFVQQKLDEIDIQLLSKKLPKLTATERAGLESKLKQVELNKQIQQQQDRIYDDIKGPQKDYQNGLIAVNNLLEQGYISTDKAAEAVRRLTYEYNQATDPLFQFNKDLADQSNLLRYNSKERETQQTLLNLRNQLAARGIELTSAETAKLTEQLTVLQRQRDIRSELDQIEQQTTGARDQLIDRIVATNLAYSNGTIGLENYTSRMNDLKVSIANLNLSEGIGTFEDAVMASLGRIREGFTTAAKGMSDAFGEFFTQVSDGFANSIGRAIVYGDSLKESLREVARSALSELISSLVKVGIQYAINAALGNTALATATAAQVAAATVVAAAWAPAAALVSLASFGANAAPANIALVETSALSAALAQLKGFSLGGYTGDFGTGQISGVVHGQEFVNNAASTRRNRPVLEAMNRGADFNSLSPEVNVVVENHGTPQQYERVPSLTAGEVRLIARDVVAQDAPGVVSSELTQPNSRVSKSLRDTHDVKRKR